MIQFTQGDLLQSDAEAFVNPVNTQGVMGKGLALQFRERYPDHYQAYRQACQAGTVRPGHLLIGDRGPEVGHPRYIIHFPTKREWRHASRMEDIESGLVALVADVQRLGIRSVAVPALGCGLGGLPWPEVSERMQQAFEAAPDVTWSVYQPNPQECSVKPSSSTRPSFRPEPVPHLPRQTRPSPARARPPSAQPVSSRPAKKPSSPGKATSSSLIAADREGARRFPCLFGSHDFSRLDTTPGAASPFAPRAGWHPEPQEYIDALRAYCTSPCGPMQILQTLARHAVMRFDRGGCLPEVVGPYAKPLNQILAAFVKKAEQDIQAPPVTVPAASRSWRKAAPADQEGGHIPKDRGGLDTGSQESPSPF